MRVVTKIISFNTIDEVVDSNYLLLLSLKMRTKFKHESDIVKKNFKRGALMQLSHKFIFGKCS